MTATLALFERWKAHKKLLSDREAAKVLGLSHGAPHLWRTGRNGSAAVIERMAKDLGEDPVPVILQAFAEAARDAEDKRTLGRLAKRLGAACWALVALMPLLSAAPNVEAMEQCDSARPIHYAHFVRIRLMAVLAFLGLLPPTPRHQPKKLEPMRWNRPASCLVCP